MGWNEPTLSWFALKQRDQQRDSTMFWNKNTKALQHSGKWINLSFLLVQFLVVRSLKNEIVLGCPYFKVPIYYI